MRVLYLVLLLALSCAAPKPKAPEVTRLPTVEVRSTEGLNTLLPEITRGKVAVVDLWATWCPACKESIPALARLAKAYEGTDLLVVGIDVGEEEQKAKDYAREAEIPYPIYFDPEFRFADSLGARRVPTLLVIDRDGAIAYRGEKLDEEALTVIRRLLEAE